MMKWIEGAMQRLTICGSFMFKYFLLVIDE